MFTRVGGEERAARLVDLDGRVDLLREPEAGEEAGRARHEEEAERDERHVAEVEHVREPLGRDPGLGRDLDAPQPREVDARVPARPCERLGRGEVEAPRRSTSRSPGAARDRGLLKRPPRAAGDRAAW